MTVYARSPDTIAREVDGEVLLVPVPSQIVDLDDCFFLLSDAVALRVWELLEFAQGLDALVDSVTSEFDVAADKARADLEAFLRELVRIGAVRQA